MTPDAPSHHDVAAFARGLATPSTTAVPVDWLSEEIRLTASNELVNRLIASLETDLANRAAGSKASDDERRAARGPAEGGRAPSSVQPAERRGALTVGRLKFEQLAPEPRTWVLGSAPLLPRDAMLSHHGHAAARLVLLFDSDDDARAEISSWLHSTSRGAPEERLISDRVERQLRDLHVDPSQSVAEAVGEPALRAWLHAAVQSGTTELPEELAQTSHDVILLPRQADHPGRLALIRESQLGVGITIANPRVLILDW